jgi:hypothetical protein
MKTFHNTKFWVTLATLVLQIAMFIFLRVTGTMSDGIVIAFLGALVTTLTAFGALNVVASGQTSPPSTGTGQ